MQKRNGDDEKLKPNVLYQKRMDISFTECCLHLSVVLNNYKKIVSADKLLNMVPLTILIILFIITEKLMGVIMEVRFGSKL